MRILFSTSIFLFALLGFSSVLSSPDETDLIQRSPELDRLKEAYGNLPLIFEANQGQTDSQVQFLSRGSGYVLFLTATEAVMVLDKLPAEDEEATGSTGVAPSGVARQGSEAAVVRMKLLGAEPEPELVGVDPLPDTMPS